MAPSTPGGFAIGTPTTPAADSIELATAERHAIDHYRVQLELDQRSAWPAAAIIAILALIFQTGWGLVLAGLIAAMALVRLRAFRPLDRGDFAGAIRWVATGTWGVAIGVVAIIPEAFPIMIINLVGPLIVAAINLVAREVRVMMTAGVGVAIVLGVLGFWFEGTGLFEAAPTSFVQFVMIMYLAAHVILLGSLVREANRVTLKGLDQVRSAHDELRRSRARVITAADRERERIERNIHDGAQQRLVALAVRLRLAAQLVEKGHAVGADDLDELHSETRRTIDELRELARGIYPAVLTERGVEEALRHLGRTAPNDVGVTCPDDVALSAQTAEAVYFVCAEALQNVAKHAGDGVRVRIEIQRREDAVSITIVDDGIGFESEAVTQSRGLLNMADRVGAAGGTIAVDSRPGDGTRVDVVVPATSVTL